MKKRMIAVATLSLLFIFSQNLLGENAQPSEQLKMLYEQLEQLYNLHENIQAIPIAKKILSLTEGMYGPDHVKTADALNNLATFYEAAGRYAEAEPLSKRALEIRTAKLGNDDPMVANSLHTLGALYYATGRYAGAEEKWEKALAIVEKAYGKEDPIVATVLNSLAELYRKTGRYTEAEPLHIRALQIRKTKRGENSLDVALSLHNLGLVYYKEGRYGEAEAVFKKSLEIREARLGPDHPDVAGSLKALAGSYLVTYKYNEAEQLMNRAMQIQLNSLGIDHLHIADTLNDVAVLYTNTGRYGEAEQLLDEAIKIAEKGYGRDHPDVALYLNNKALVCLKIGSYDEAERLLKKVLAIREARLGKDHPDVAMTQYDLARIYYDVGRYSEAELLSKRALEIQETKLGKDHPQVGRTLSTLAGLYGIRENYSLSHQFLSRAVKISEQTMENVFPILSERQQLIYMPQQMGLIHAFCSLTGQRLRGDTRAVEDAFIAWLRWKGAVMEAQVKIVEACSDAEDPAIRNHCSERDNIRRTLASLVRSKPDNMDTITYFKTLAKYEEKKNAIEAELSSQSADFRRERLVSKVDVDSISNLLPKGSVYLDFAMVLPHDFQKKRSADKDRYLVFVLSPGEPTPIALVDLGHADVIHSYIWNYHKIIQEAVRRKRPPDTQTLRESLRALHRLVLEPLTSHLRGKKQLFISPEGGLHFIPFEAFVTPEGKYVIQEDISIHYVTAGRDIVRFRDEARAQGKALILADPDYDLAETERIAVAKRMGVSGMEVRGQVSRQAGTLFFARLPDTRVEAKKIEEVIKKHGEVIYCQDKEALQEVLFAASYPRVLHIATHGYFLADQKITPQLGPGMDTLDSLPPDALNAYENPMLRSGIALAGANTSQRQGKDYGMVSADKVLGLKLKGTDLVVLSACETGMGDVQISDGVFGLKRAFILSGAKTVVMSLWSVPSKETTELMKSFYTRWSEGKTKAEALREAKLELMKENPNPFFWGAFVMVGDPGK